MVAPVVAWESMLVLGQAEPGLPVKEIMARRVETLQVAAVAQVQSEATEQTALLSGLAALV
jgi:hypothetical protein